MRNGEKLSKKRRKGEYVAVKLCGTRIQAHRALRAEEEDEDRKQAREKGTGHV